MLICILADKLKKISAGVHLISFSGDYFAEGRVFLLFKSVFLTLSLTRTRAGRTGGLRGQAPTGKDTGVKVPAGVVTARKSPNTDKGGLPCILLSKENATNVNHLVSRPARQLAL